MFGALIGMGAGSFTIEPAVMRTVFVLGLAMVVMWAVAEISATESLAERASAPRQERRFLKLRGQVDCFLADIRQLNWLARDARLGIQNPDGIKGRIDATTRQLIDRVALLQQSAGVEARRQSLA